MQEQFIQKVISASAGTGKTYRLSLEYISLLLKFRKQQINYREILVITFTKKATAEIRERIFDHLDSLVRQTKAGNEIIKNLQSLTGVPIGADHLSYLQSIYFDMLTNKSSVRISTIDSFTSQVFASIIAPFHGITSYEMDERIEERVMEEIYEHLLTNKHHLALASSLFQRSGKRSIEDYERFIKSLLKHRWLFFFLKESSLGEPTKLPDEKPMFNNYKDLMLALLKKFDSYLTTLDRPITTSECFKKEFRELFFGEQESDFDFVPIVNKILTADFARNKARELLKLESFWNGTKLLRKKEQADFKQELLIELEKAQAGLAEYLLVTDFAQEQQDILRIAQLAFEKYDQIKFRDKIFSYDDISYYTFRYLYDPDLSLIEGDAVSNEFYDYLTNRLRFLLIDEFQDTSLVQYKLLLPMMREIVSGIGTKEYGGVIVVGDEKQSIYGWRGGERDLLLQMPLILRESEQAVLNTSYRSSGQVTSFINSIFNSQRLARLLAAQNIRWPYQPVTTVKNSSSGYVDVAFRNSSTAKKDSTIISHKEEAIREFVEKTVLPVLRSGRVAARETALLSRKNDDLRKIAAVLDEHAVPYVLNSSASILDHRAIKPLFFLLEFFVSCDYLALLKFLRSDYVLMPGDLLKQVLVAYQDLSQSGVTSSGLLSRVSHLSPIKKIDFLQNRRDELEGTINGLLIFFKLVFEQFNCLTRFPLESDAKNITHFLKLVSQFQDGSNEFPNTLAGFLAYCQENRDQEDWVQQGLEDVDALNLMTIHKSKGLEFDTVFLYWDLNPRGGRQGGTAQLYVEYSNSFSDISDFAITYNYDFVLAKSHKRHLYESKIIKERIEELNNFYVALTRSKNNLYLYFLLQKSGGLEAFLGDKIPPEQWSISRVLTDVMLHDPGIAAGIIKESENQTLIRLGGPESTASPERHEPLHRADISGFFDFERQLFLIEEKQRLERFKHINLKTAFLENKSVMKGIIAHYYLSFIKHNTEQEQLRGKQLTLAKYGTLLPGDELARIFAGLNEFVQRWPDLFSASRWPLVFTEFSLFHPSGKEVRLDRIMISKGRGKIKIIDYKTGSIWEEEQIELYVEAVMALPICQKEHFNVEGTFLEISLDPGH